MKKKALLIATLTVMSVAAQSQPGQTQNQQSQQKSGEASASQPGQPAQPGQPRQPGEPQPGLLDQSSQGRPGESQTGQGQAGQTSQSRQSGQSEATPGQSAQGGPGQAQKGKSQQDDYQKTQASNLQQFIDYKVVDKQEKQIGKIEALWEDQSGQPAFLAVKREKSGQGSAQQAQQGKSQSQQAKQRQQAQQGEQEKLLVIPAQSAEVNRAKRTVRIPYNEQVLQSAPTLKSEDKLDARAQTRIIAFYRQHGYQPRDQSQQRRQSSAAQGADVKDQASITLKEENVTVGTREVDAGGILLRKIVRTDQVSKPVELQREEIVIERVEGTGRPVSGEVGSFQEQEIYIPLRREEPVVQKEVEIKERVNIGKETETERREISEQVREEDLQIIKEQGTEINVEGQRQGETPRGQQQRENQSNPRP